MSKAMKMIVAGHVKVKDRCALCDLLAHRRKMLGELQAVSGVGSAKAVQAVRDELAIIEAGLEELRPPPHVGRQTGRELGYCEIYGFPIHACHGNCLLTGKIGSLERFHFGIIEIRKRERPSLRRAVLLLWPQSARKAWFAPGPGPDNEVVFKRLWRDKPKVGTSSAR